LTIPTYSEIIGMHLMAHESPQIFIQKPSIALGNQVCYPICANFPTTPMKSKIQITITA
jgi:hypothetical protein